LALASEVEIDSTIELDGLLPKGEYEGIYGDEATKRIYVICKNCEVDNPKQTTTGYIFQVGDAIYPVGNFEIKVDEIKALTGKVRKGFQPAALAKNPITHDWYIISGLNKLLVVTDSAWKIKETAPLNGNIFNQPEGVCFDTEGNMYISNEGDDISDGNILKFKRLPDQKAAVTE
jgi:secreted PhoX family phosphatase